MAQASITAVIIFLALLGTIHIIKPEIDPSWRVISEYEIGRFGWLMQIAFFFLAAASLSLFIALKSHLKSLTGRIGLVLLLITVVGVTMGALFVSDPITTPRDEFTQTGNLHNVGGVLSVLVFPFVATFITLALSRIKTFKSIRLILILLLTFVWVSVLMFYTIYYIAGETGPNTLIGWPNRVFIFFYSMWLIVVAWKCRFVHP